MKRPAFQFYPAEWLADTELQSCRPSSRGLWINLCSVMHNCKPYGHLTINNAAMTDDEAAQACKFPLKVYRQCISELITRGVARQNGAGIIYSARMVKDEALRDKRGSFGALSMQNPNVPRPKQLQRAMDTMQKIEGIHDGPNARPSPAIALKSPIYKSTSSANSVAPATSPATAQQATAPAMNAQRRDGKPIDTAPAWSTPPPILPTLDSATPPGSEPAAKLPWMMTQAGILSKGKAIDLPPNEGEPIEQYRERIRNRLSQLQGDH